MIRAKNIKTRYPDSWPGGYKLGMWVWIFHRITGLFIMGYLLFHLVEVMLSHFGSDVYDIFFGWGYTRWMQSLDLLLMAALLFHSMNGLRVILFDLGIGIRKQKIVFASVMLLGLATYYFLAIDILPYVIGRKLF